MSQLQKYLDYKRNGRSEIRHSADVGGDAHHVRRRLEFSEDRQVVHSSAGSDERTPVLSHEQEVADPEGYVKENFCKHNIGDVVEDSVGGGPSGRNNELGRSGKYFGRPFDSRRKLVHHLFRPPNDGKGKFYRRLRSLSSRKHNNSTGGVYAATHDDHIHVVHGCNFSDERCRCTVIKACFGRPYKSSTSPAEQWNDDRRGRMWQHLGEGPGKRRWHIRQDSFDKPGNIDGDIDLSACEERIPSEEVCSEDELFQCTLSASGERDFSPVNSDGPCEPARKKSKPSWFVSTMEAVALAKRKWISSPDAILNCKEMTESIHNYNIVMSRRKLTDSISSAMMSFYDELKYMDMDQIASYIDKDANFGYTRMATFDDSFTALKMFFEQFDCDFISYVTMFKKWFNHDLGKKNTICLIGPPSCGKTWVATAFAKLGLFVGTIGAWNRNDNRFAFNNCVNVRIIVHDECKQPLVDIGYLEKLKEIYAGAEGSVDRKFANDARASGCPVIATCNVYPVSACDQREAFAERINYVYCQQIPDMKPLCEFPCNPLAIVAYMKMVEDLSQ